MRVAPTDYDDNVVPFPKSALDRAQNMGEAALAELPVLQRHAPRACSHERSWVDPHARTVNCRDCGIALDPIDVLTEIAARRERVVYHGRRMRRAADYLEHEVERLKREERNAKARLKRALGQLNELAGGA